MKNKLYLLLALYSATIINVSVLASALPIDLPITLGDASGVAPAARTVRGATADYRRARMDDRSRGKLLKKALKKKQLKNI